MSYGINTLLCVCTPPVAGQTYTTRKCSSCASGGCSIDTVLASCSTTCPRTGTYQSAGCQPGTITTLGSDIVCSPCPAAPANAVYTAGNGCTLTWTGSAGNYSGAFPGCAAATNRVACYALADVYFATQLYLGAWAAALSAPGATPDRGWAFSATNYCAWLGVGCAYATTGVQCVSDMLSGCVLRSLTLSGWGIAGSLPASLGNLSSLLQLAVDNNDLLGTIPPSLSSLTTLTMLCVELGCLVAQFIRCLSR